ncbi:MAG: helicase-related protein, partial [Acidimicrobiales bacterium]
RWGGETVEVLTVLTETEARINLVLKGPAGLTEVTLSRTELDDARQPANDGQGDSAGAIAGLWGKWMEWATPRIRSAAASTKPIKLYAHQDEAVFVHMLPQPRLRFLLADEPGTGKTIMTGQYIVEGRRRRVVPGKVLIVPPAHLVNKWLNDLHRYFGVDAEKLDSVSARSPRPLRDDVDTWVVSVDLFTHNPDVLRKVAGPGASWSLVVFDEAHRLTPTSQYLGAAREVARSTHHLLLLTATPHRGKEWYFQSLLNLLAPGQYPVTAGPGDTDPDRRMRPGKLHFLRRMKEDLRDHDGSKLFKERFAETLSVDLRGDELVCYDAVLTYVDSWYDQRAVLARSIYGKRAASGIRAAAETLRRRRDVLAGTQAGQVAPPAPQGFDDPRMTGALLDDDESWELAETSIVNERSSDRRGELKAVDNLLADLDRWLDSGQEPAKWAQVADVCAKHGISSTGGQLLVFTEFTDTATWLRRLFVQAGFSTELLSGATPQVQRDRLQGGFLAGDYQVLVSTDAGGEGIDLQSAHVMIDWDVPWSLVRLEQRAGRLHRIGQQNAVFIYHLVAPATREGRVQEVLLTNLDAAAQALDGRVFDLMDATAARSGFDFAAALTDAYRGVDAIERVPSTDTLVAQAKELAAEEDALRTPTDLSEANARFAKDRLEAVNPVMVEGFLRNIAGAAGWDVSPGPAERIFTVTPRTGTLPAPLGGRSGGLVSVDGKATAKARAAGADTESIVTLGPTETTFRDLLGLCAERFAPELYRGAVAIDHASISPYSLFVFTTELQTFDGITKTSRPQPFLIRHSGGSAFAVDWAAVANLRAADGTATRPAPGARIAASEAAEAAANEQERRAAAEQQRWVKRAREDLDALKARWQRQLRDLSDEQRATARDEFEADRARRLEDLEHAEEVTSSPPQLIGWLDVRPGATIAEIGYDPDSEVPAIQLVMAQLENDNFDVDDRQTAGLGYDLFAQHRLTREQRLVEVKGLLDSLAPVTLEANEWAQAMQRGAEFWLYVVTGCGTTPILAVSIHDPAGSIIGGPRLIERFQVPVSQLRRFTKDNP